MTLVTRDWVVEWKDATADLNMLGLTSGGANGI